MESVDEALLGKEGPGLRRRAKSGGRSSPTSSTSAETKTATVCCRANTSNGKYKLIDLESQVACRVLGPNVCNYVSPQFDVNSLSTPTNKRPEAKRSTIPLCYKVVGEADICTNGCNGERLPSGDGNRR